MLCKEERNVSDGQHPSSFRDPRGFIFLRKGEVYRQINESFQKHYDLLSPQASMIPLSVWGFSSLIAKKTLIIKA
jgi:hypothetical protein